MSRRPRHAVAATLGLALAVLAPGLVACSVDQVQTVEGLVISVQGDSPASVQSFTLRTADGALIEFSLATEIDFGHGGFPGAHLREHQGLGQPVRVTYRVAGSGTNQQRIAVRLEDAA